MSGLRAIKGSDPNGRPEWHEWHFEVCGAEAGGAVKEKQVKFKRSILVVVLLIPVLTLAAGSDGRPDDWADWGDVSRTIVRLAPTVFNELPSKIVKELQAMECTIPQMGFIPARVQNVISGSFAAKNQKDWAVLCSINGVSSIRIFWGGAAKCPSEMVEGPDTEQMSGIDGYSRAISPISEKSMVDAPYDADDAGVTLLPVSHEGISVYVSDNKGRAYYCRNGVWLGITHRSPFQAGED